MGFTEDSFPDRIFVKNNLTPMEELLFARKQIKELKIEVGKLKSEVEHLESENSSMKVTPAITKQDLKEIRVNERVVQLRNALQVKNKHIQQLRKDHSKLINELCLLREEKKVRYMKTCPACEEGLIFGNTCKACAGTGFVIAEEQKIL